MSSFGTAGGECLGIGRPYIISTSLRAALIQTPAFSENSSTQNEGHGRRCLCNETEVKVIDPNKLEIIESVGCKVREVCILIHHEFTTLVRRHAGGVRLTLTGHLI